MLTLVEARNSAGALLSLALEDISDGLVLADVTGLDPVKATIVSSVFAQQDGAQFQSAHRETRNILVTIGLEPDYVSTSVRDLRNRVYGFFMPKTQVEFRFYDDSDLVVSIVGRIESCETSIFSKDPEVVVSIICHDPDFLDLETEELHFNTTDDVDEELIEYVGTVDAGFTFVLNVDRTLTEFTIFLRTPDGAVNPMDVAIALEADDVLTISTVVGSKSAILVRSAVASSVLYGVSAQAIWHQLQNGDNYIRVAAEGADIPYDITYTNRYGGL